MNLGAVGYLGLVEDLFGETLVPIAVEAEVLRLKQTTERFARVTIPNFIRVESLADPKSADLLKVRLHPGEAEAIALTRQVGGRWLLVDEVAARNEAKKLGISTLGCLGILLKAKENGLVPKVRPIMERLENEAGFWVGATLRARVLAAAQE